MYANSNYLETLSEGEAIAWATLAYRCVAYYDSPLKLEHGDGVIVGASELKQLEEAWKG